MPSVRGRHSQQVAFRADAKADDTGVVIGGWDASHGADTTQAKWFSERLTPENAPWVFQAGEPFRVIAALELLATLCCILAFSESDGTVTLSGITDNRGNSCVTARMMTTKYPLVCVLMEIAAQLMHRKDNLSLFWAPREQNIEADALTNEHFHGFDPKLRVRLCMRSVNWLLLHQMLEAGASLYKDIKDAKLERVDKLLAKAESGEPLRKKHKVLKFKQREPWE